MEAMSREEKREITKTRLRSSATQAFAGQGVRAASVDGISQAAGLSRGAFYANYSTKEDMLLELMSEWLERQASEWSKVVAEAADAQAVLQGFLARFQRSRQDGSGGLLWVELTLHAERNPKFAAHYQAFIAAHHRHVARVFAALFEKAGKALPAAPEELAAAALSFGTSLALQSAHGTQRGNPAYAGDMFLLYLRGLLAVAGPARAARPTGPAGRPGRTSLKRSTT
jgi:AcrR family transcriptional regulator